MRLHFPHAVLSDTITAAVSQPGGALPVAVPITVPVEDVLDAGPGLQEYPGWWFSPASQSEPGQVPWGPWRAAARPPARPPARQPAPLEVSAAPLPRGNCFAAVHINNRKRGSAKSSPG